MRPSVLALSMLAANAAAWRWSSQAQCSAETVTVTVTANAPAATTSAAIVTVSSAEQVQASTLLTRKSTTSVAAPQTTTAAAAQPTATSGSGSLTTDQQAALDAHNAARAEVGVSNLSWDSSLLADAQAYAEKLAASGNLVHSGVSGLGENLYMQSGTDNALVNAANAFISEKSSYNGEVIDSSNYMTFGHYTQVVWSSTTKFVLASAKGSKGTFVVARYSPPGNYIGQKPY